MRLRLGIATALVTVTIAAVPAATQATAESATYLDTFSPTFAPGQLATAAGGFTGLDATPIPGVYLAVTGVGAGPAPGRFRTIRIPLGADGRITSDRVEVLAESPLSNASGSMAPGSGFAPSAIRLADGEVLIAGSTPGRQGVAPRLSGFDMTGSHIRDYSLPRSWMPGATGQSGIAAAPATLGAAVHGGLVTVISGAPLRQDGALSGGPRARLAQIDRYSGLVMREYAYELSMGDGALATGLLALSGTDYLVLERGVGADGRPTARLYRARVGDATDITARHALVGNEAPMSSELLLDLGATGAEPGAIEAMSLGPVLSDGSRTVVLATGGAAPGEGVEPSRIHVVRLDP
ncbi:esterase-like activity of phytase family protein [Hoyosella sp. G463]|uniref:Esterase-like activity of phytase family protein n=1 Tax=Lolliginicoccus lacisalsi TaxID=2742202 RepID=A0A927J8Z6_9ACTN|nr:esterase-like activity of phytase family protein [Lolliginicoccus lacisalsi]MBD8504893.1 esterase-like activity of phytase family protein [Lolliginicoccus lacisalsi]